ncbi:p21-activated protein kinase-interacting protein 1-like isoform X2 [Ylistrum balloti]|nr:p21-activated protein kinase-interacting protein 1-like isoform X2 [Ylistrum balloti]
MFSASEDGTIGIWKYFTWECLKTLRGHTSAVNYISIHPSGKLALSVGRDKTLRTWNLITGRSAYTTNIKQEATQVVWSLNGNHYAVVFATRIDIYNTQTAEVVSTVKTTHRVNDLAFISKTVMVYGGEGGQLHFYNIISKTTLHNIDTQTNRIRQMSVVPAPLEEGEENNENKQWLFIAASDGHIKIFQVQLKEDEVDTVLVASHDTTFRLTCMAVSSFKSKIPDGTNDDSQKHVTEKIFKVESSDTVTESIDVPQKVVSRDNTAEKSCKKGAAKKLKKSQKTSTKRRAESESEDSGTNVSHDVIDVDSEDSFTPVKAKKVKFTNENVEKEKARKKLKQRKEKKEIVKTKRKAVTQGQPKKKKIKS